MRPAGAVVAAQLQRAPRRGGTARACRGRDLAAGVQAEQVRHVAVVRLGARRSPRTIPAAGRRRRPGTGSSSRSACAAARARKSRRRPAARAASMRSSNRSRRIARSIVEADADDAPSLAVEVQNSFSGEVDGAVTRRPLPSSTSQSRQNSRRALHHRIGAVAQISRGRRVKR